MSWKLRNPVRVIRGSKLDSPYSPTEGYVQSMLIPYRAHVTMSLSYRYDGLYMVDDVRALLVPILHLMDTILFSHCRRT